MWKFRNDDHAKSSNERKEEDLYYLVDWMKWIQTFLRSTRAHGGVVNVAVTIAFADALVKSYLD